MPDITTTNISRNSAGIYSASLLYQMNGKCGSDTAHKTEVLKAGETWDASAESLGWKLVPLVDASTLTTIEADNIQGASRVALTGNTFDAMSSIMLNGITKVTINAGLWILYKDCPQS